MLKLYHKWVFTGGSSCDKDKAKTGKGASDVVAELFYSKINYFINDILQEAAAVTRTRPTDTGASDVVDTASGECPVSPRVVRDRQAYRMC